MALDQLFLEQFGGVDSNSLCYLLNNNIPRNNNVNIIDVEPDVMQHSSYHDDASLSNLFEARADVFSIVSLNCQSINAKIDQINIKLQQLKSNGHEFSAICLQETWLSEDSDISLLKNRCQTLTNQTLTSRLGLANKPLNHRFPILSYLQLNRNC